MFYIGRFSISIQKLSQKFFPARIYSGTFYMHPAVAFSLGVVFTTVVIFMFKENTVIYKDGYRQCITEMESK